MLDYAPPRTAPIMGSLWPTIGQLIAGVAWALGFLVIGSYAFKVREHDFAIRV